MSFNCRRCGRCCRGLILEDHGVYRGLTLLPEETSLFPPEQVEEYLGYGRSPSDKRFKVLAYQLNASNCPHLVDNLCSIYPNRPASCRQFPFSLDPTPDGDTLLGVDMNCPTAVEMINNHENIVSLPSRGSALRLYELKKIVLNAPTRVWIYDLFSHSWIRFSDTS